MLNKKLALSSMACLVLFGSSLAYASTPANPSTVNFEATGNITSSSCELQPTQDVSTVAVAFNALHDLAYLKANGAESTSTITLSLSNCSAGQVSASILGSADAVDAEVLSIDQTAGAAKNVGIAFMYDDQGNSGEQVFLPLNTGQTPALESAASHKFIFMMTPVSETNKTPEPGTIAATAQIHINYL